MAPFARPEPARLLDRSVRQVNASRPDLAPQAR